MMHDHEVDLNMERGLNKTHVNLSIEDTTTTSTVRTV